MKKLIILLLLIPAFFAVMAQSHAGQAMFFDYVAFQNDNLRRYINCGNDNSLNPGDNLTMETWVKIHDSGWNQKIFGKLNPSFNSGYLLAVDQGKCYPEAWNPSGNDVLAGFVPPNGYWYHFAMTFAKGDSLKAYVNGIMVGGTPVSNSGITANTDDLIIGIAPWDLSNFQYFGHLDEVRLWNIAKSEQQLQDEMHIKLSGSESGLISYWNFDQTAGTVPDQGPNSNDGTLINLTTADWRDSWAPIGDATMATMNDIHGLWNGNGFTNPRFAITDNGLSLSGSLSNDNYAVFGHDGGTGNSSMDAPSGAPANFDRVARTWYVNPVDTVITDLTFNFSNAAAGGTAIDANESAINYTLLYRTGTSGNFTAVAQGATKGSGTVTFEDVELDEGYYTVSVGDSPILSRFDQPEMKLLVYPNPSSGKFQIEISGQVSGGTLELELLDLSGKVIDSQSTVNGKATFNNSGLASGIYFLKAGTSTVKKIIVY